MRGFAENDGYNALMLAAGLMWRDVALLRTISRFLRQIRVPYSQDYMWATLRKHAALAAKIVELFHARFDPRASDAMEQRKEREAALSGRDRGRAAKGRKPRRGPHRPPFRQRGAGGGPHQLLSARQRRPAEAADRHQVREQEDRRPAAAEAAVRNLRLFAARRGRAPALRQGGARRHPLVRPAAGLPHRNPRPGEGAAGQERGDRAGRLQGRLRAEAPAGRRLARGDPGRRHRRLQAVHLDAARHHRQPRPQRRGAARQRGAARRRRSLSRRRRRQGHRDVLRHRQRDFRGAQFLAGRRLRLRRLGRLRPQEDGHHRPRRLGIGEAPFPRDGRRHHHDAVHRGRRRRHVGRRVRQRHAAREHHAAARRVRPSRHLHRSRSRSGAQLRRARAAVRAAALELAGLRQGADLHGRRRVPALVQGDRRCRRRRRRRSASGRTRRRRRR